MYGLMLPSGNDAAHALASFLGEVLMIQDKDKEKTDAESLVFDDAEEDNNYGPEGGDVDSLGSGG